MLETIDFPEPVVHVSIEPKTKVDQEKLSVALARLAEEDPTFQVRTDEETGQTVISGMGELHLEVIVDRMKREFKVEAAVGRPQVAYRETCASTVKKVEGKFIRQTGGSGQYGVVYIDLEPAPGEGFDFVNKIKGGAVPSEFIPAVEKGIEEALESGVKAGYPMVDVRVTLIDGKYHDTDSSEMAFKIAGSMALKEAAQASQARAARAGDGRRGRHAEEFLGDVIGDLSAAAAGSRARSRAATRWRSRPACRCRRCSATPPTCVPHTRAGRTTRCSSTATRKSRSNIAEEIVEAPHRRAGRRRRRIDEYVSGFAVSGPNEALERSRSQWRRRSSSATSRTSTSARSVTSTTARRR